MDSASLEFAYRYPFSAEAKEIIRGMELKSVQQKHVAIGKSLLDSALKDEPLVYTKTSIDNDKLAYIIGYVYARMLVSALRKGAYIGKYAAAEAKRSAVVLEGDSGKDMRKVISELNIQIKQNENGFEVGLIDYLKFIPKAEGAALVNQKLNGGTVVLDNHSAVALLEVAIEKEVRKGLPIEQKLIPKEVMDASRSISMPLKPIAVPKSGKAMSWIDRLLKIPIADCRHRTVNLILAPYLVNVKGMEVEAATAAINSYIDSCKIVNPDTKVTEKYIKYQCEYAKGHGMRPLSFARAKDLLSSADVDLLEEGDKNE